MKFAILCPSIVDSTFSREANLLRRSRQRSSGGDATTVVKLGIAEPNVLDMMRTLAHSRKLTPMSLQTNFEHVIHNSTFVTLFRNSHHEHATREYSGQPPYVHPVECPVMPPESQSQQQQEPYCNQAQHQREYDQVYSYPSQHQQEQDSLHRNESQHLDYPLPPPIQDTRSADMRIESYMTTIPLELQHVYDRTKDHHISGAIEQFKSLAEDYRDLLSSHQALKEKVEKLEAENMKKPSEGLAELNISGNGYMGYFITGVRVKNGANRNGNDNGGNTKSG
jgi:hypothetical protein